MTFFNESFMAVFFIFIYFSWRFIFTAYNDPLFIFLHPSNLSLIHFKKIFLIPRLDYTHYVWNMDRISDYIRLFLVHTAWEHDHMRESYYNHLDGNCKCLFNQG